MIHRAAEYSAGLLAPADEGPFLDHLAACARCQQELADEVQLCALEAELRRGAPGDDLVVTRPRLRALTPAAPASHAPTDHVTERSDEADDDLVTTDDVATRLQEADHDHVTTDDVAARLHEADDDLVTIPRAPRSNAPVDDLARRSSRRARAMLGTAALGARRDETLRARRRGLVVGLAGAALAASAALALVVLRRPAEEPAIEVALAPERALEPRLTDPVADRHRPYVVSRAGAEHEMIAPSAIAGLEQAGDRRGLAAALILAGERVRARGELAALPASPDRDSDLAALALVEGDAEEAIRLSDAALIARPEHSQARWNRALALVQLGLLDAAAADFARVRDGAWAREANERAAALRAQVGDRAQAWYAARDAGYAMVRGGAPLAIAVARRFPGTARLFVYDALRVAAPAELDRLAAIAGELDVVFGGDAMMRALAAARTHAAQPGRAALVADYQHLVARDGSLDDAAWRAWLDRARRAGATDLILGGLVVRGAVASHLDEYRRLAGATGDPWFELLAAEQTGLARAAAGDPRGAEDTWRAASDRCAARPVAYRCALIERQLADLYKQQHRLAEARRAGRRALELALADNEWAVAIEVLMKLGDVEMYADRYAMARAFFDEVELAAPDDCQLAAEVHQLRAEVAMYERRYPAARAELAALALCPGARLSNNRVLLAVDLARLGTPVGDPTALIAAARAAGTGAVGALFADVMTARYAIDRDAGARAALAAALVRARTLDDGLARTLEAIARLTLAIDGARRGDWAAMFDTVAAPTGAPPPERCAVTAAVDDARVAVAVRGAAGATVGRYLLRPTAFDPAAIVPADLQRALAGCDSIAVLALPPLIGEPRLLARTLPWAFRVGRGATPTTVLPARRVVVADAMPPAHLGLPMLAAWTGAPGDVVLRGAEATPRRVLAELADATELEIHAHGIVDLSTSDVPLVALSPAADGAWALTSEALRRAHLRGAPAVILADCRAAALARYEAWGLPTAFVTAGARTVIASSAAIDDREAGPVFERLRDELRRGASPGAALASVARDWLARDPRSWVADLMVFE